MDLSTISVEVIIGVCSGLAVSVGAYIKLKSRIDRLEMENISQEKEIIDLKERKKEMGAALTSRIDDLTHDFTELQRDMTTGYQNLQDYSAQMELRIVKEIQKLRK